MLEQPINVAEGARQLGISERTLRRVLREPELEAKLHNTKRQVGGRDRLVIMIPPPLMEVLRNRFANEQAPQKKSRVVAATVGQQTGITFTPASLVAVYRRLVTEKNVVIGQQEARIADLKSAIELERERSKRTQLRALDSFSIDSTGKDVVISTSLASELHRLFASGAGNQLAMELDSPIPTTNEASQADAAADADRELAELEADPASLVKVYEWMLKEKDHVIDQQRQRIVDLQASLEHERDQAARANLILDIREPQSRRLLPANEANETEPAPKRSFWRPWLKPAAR